MTFWNDYLMHYIGLSLGVCVCVCVTFWNDYLMHYIGLSLGVCVCVCVVCVYLGVCVYGCLVRFNRYIGTSVLFVDAACNGSLLLFALKNIYIFLLYVY